MSDRRDLPRAASGGGACEAAGFPVVPLKDTIPTDRIPVVTLLAIAGGALAQLVTGGEGVLVALAAALFLWLFGVSVEDAMSRPRFTLFCLLGAGAAVGAARALGADAAVAAGAATGAASGALGGHLRLYPRARVVALAPVPTAFTFFELPSWALAAAWAAIQLAFAVAADTVAWVLAALAALAVSALAAAPLTLRRKRPHADFPVPIRS